MRDASIVSIVACALWFLIAPLASARDDRAAILGFETLGAGGSSGGWSGFPHGTHFVDSTVVHGGRYSGRLERAPGSPGEFSAFSTSVPVDFAGDSLELRGWIKYEGVTKYAGLWQRQDGRDGVVQFDNMQSRWLSGSAEWAEVRIVLPLDRRARTVVFGALLGGEGRLWVDDLRLLVDGAPFAAAPEPAREKTVFDTDREFDGGSNVSIGRLSRAQIENLRTLGKVWGFLKYHDPRIVDGKRHWDYDLFRVLPHVLAARDRNSANRAMVSWVSGFGEAPRCSACAKLPGDRPMRPRLDWISDRSLLGRDLSDRLRRTYENRESRTEQHYVSFADGPRNPAFSNEFNYPGSRVPDAGYRLLALFRLWNIVEYWSPYRDLIEADWDGVLEEFIPRVVAADSSDAYLLEMIAFAVRLGDGHASVFGSRRVHPPSGTCRIPATFRFVEDRLVVKGYAHRRLGPGTGLDLGDVVAAVDGVPVDSLVSRWRHLYSGSNEPARLRGIAAFIGWGPCDSARLTIERPGGRSVLPVWRAPADSLDAAAGRTNDLPGETFRRLSDDLAYLKLSSVKDAEVPSYVQGALGAKCLVIDIRNYPSAFMPFALGGHLVDRPTRFAAFTIGDPSNPGSFWWRMGDSIPPLEPRFEGKVAVLVDETSQSQSEYTAMAFRAAPATIVVGSTTAGADGNVSRIPLPGGLTGVITGLGIFYPDHRPTQRIGIVPDLTVRPTVAGIRAGRDEVLEAAVKRVLGREINDAERSAIYGSDAAGKSVP